MGNISRATKALAVSYDMLIFFDANVIIDEYAINTISYRAFVRYCKKKNVPLLLPHIAVLEAERVYVKKLTKYNADIEALLTFGMGPDSVAGPGVLTGASIDPSALVMAFSRRLFGPEKDFDVRLIQNKPEHRQAAIQRVLEGKSPIKAEGENARDALIWFSILDEIKGKDESVVFISGDGDFASKKGRQVSDELHLHLRQDLDSIGFDKNKFKFYDSLNDFLVSVSRELTDIEQRIVDLQSEIDEVLTDIPRVSEEEFEIERMIRGIQGNLKMISWSLVGDVEYPDPEQNPKLISAREEAYRALDQIPKLSGVGSRNALYDQLESKRRQLAELEEQFNQVT